MPRNSKVPELNDAGSQLIDAPDAKIPLPVVAPKRMAPGPELLNTMFD
jgi:hypothetical protein